MAGFVYLSICNVFVNIFHPESCGSKESFLSDMLFSLSYESVLLLYVALNCRQIHHVCSSRLRTGECYSSNKQHGSTVSFVSITWVSEKTGLIWFFPAPSSTVEHIYQKKTQLEHILHRPYMIHWKGYTTYVGVWWRQKRWWTSLYYVIAVIGERFNSWMHIIYSLFHPFS